MIEQPNLYVLLIMPIIPVIIGGVISFVLLTKNKKYANAPFIAGVCVSVLLLIGYTFPIQSEYFDEIDSIIAESSCEELREIYDDEYFDNDQYTFKEKIRDRLLLDCILTSEPKLGEIN